MTYHDPVALLDMDGTVADYTGAIIRDLEKLRAPCETGPLIYPKDQEPEHIKARIRLIREKPGWWRNLEKLEQGFKVVEMLKKIGFHIHVLTKGPWTNPNSWTEKVLWCREHLADIPVTITENKGLVYGRVLVDDWPPYLRSWLAWRPRGLVIMPAQPWNEDFEHPNVIRFSDNDEEVYAALEAAAARGNGEELVLSR